MKKYIVTAMALIVGGTAMITSEGCVKKNTCPAYSSLRESKQPSMKETKKRRKNSNSGQLF